jgi:DNA-binding XRE family transcriptional regulator
LNLTLLKSEIDESKFTKNEIAEYLGITRQGFYNKLNGTKEFKASEVKKLSQILNLSSKRFNEIFFNDYVDKNAN